MNHRNLNGSQLSQMAGVSEATISRYLNNLRTPTVQNLMLLSDALGVSSDFLLGLSDHPEDKMLTRAYSIASSDDKHVIWTILEKYGENYEHSNDWN